MNDDQRGEAIYHLQSLARERAALEWAWVDFVIAVMELEFTHVGWVCDSCNTGCNPRLTTCPVCGGERI